MLLGQWNYWCKYMSEGPRDLPKPLLFNAENETPRESFLYALYGTVPNVAAIIRLIVLPVIALFGAMRGIANVTCRNPIWPDAIEKISVIIQQTTPMPSPVPVRPSVGLRRYWRSVAETTPTIPTPRCPIGTAKQAQGPMLSSG